MPRPPSVYWHERDRCWITLAVGEVLPSGRRKGARNYELGPRQKSEAKAWLRELLGEEVAARRRVDRFTLSAVVDAYLEWSAGRLAPATLRAYRERLKAFIAFRRRGERTLGEKRLDALEADDAEAFVEDGRRRGWSAIYVRSILTTVGSCVAWSIRKVRDRPDGLPPVLLAVDPFASVALPSVGRPPKRYCGAATRGGFMEYAAIRAALNDPTTSGYRFDRLFVAALRFIEATGARPGEAVRLEWSHIRWGEKRAILPGKSTTATGERRIIPLPPHVLALLRSIRRLPGGHRRWVFTCAARDGHTWKDGHREGSPWEIGAFVQKFRVWRNAADEIGVPVRNQTGELLTMYQLRRDMGADVLRATGSHSESANVLGHSVAVNERYYSSFEADRAVERVDEIARLRREAAPRTATPLVGFNPRPANELSAMPPRRPVAPPEPKPRPKKPKPAPRERRDSFGDRKRAMLRALEGA